MTKKIIFVISIFAFCRFAHSEESKNGTNGGPELTLEDVETQRYKIVADYARQNESDRLAKEQKSEEERKKAVSEVVTRAILAEQNVLSAEAEALENKEIFPILLCLRQIVEEQLGGADGLKLAASYSNLLSQQTCASEKKRTEVNMYSKIRNSCEATLASLSSRPSKKMSQKDRMALLTTIDSTPAAKEFLRGIVQPKAECNTRGLSLTGALWVGAGARVNASYCKSTTGRTWLEIGAGAGVAGGAFAIVLAPTWGKTRYYRGDSLADNFIEISRHKEKGWAILGGPLQAEGEPWNSADLHGFLAGFGLIGTGNPGEDDGYGVHYGNANLKIVQLRSSAQALGKWFRACFNPSQEYRENNFWRDGPHALDGKSTPKFKY